MQTAPKAEKVVKEEDREKLGVDAFDLRVDATVPLTLLRKRASEAEDGGSTWHLQTGCAARAPTKSGRARGSGGLDDSDGTGNDSDGDTEEPTLEVGVTLEAANHYGFAAPSQLGSASRQLTNQLGAAAINRFTLRVGADGACSLESLAHPGWFVAPDDAPVDTHGMRAYRCVLTDGSAGGGGAIRPTLRQVAARNGAAMPEWFSLEAAHAPGFLLCHCNGSLWFFDRPANSEQIFRQARV